MIRDWGLEIRDWCGTVKDTLQDCLARLERGEALEQVLASCALDEKRDELESLLALATNVRRAAPKMSESAKARVRYQLYGAMRAHPAPRARLVLPTWLARVVVACLVVVLVGSGTLVAVAESAPGKPLFPARAALNETRARLATNPRTVLLLHLQNAEERLEDVQIRKQHRLLDEAAIFWM
ncbi:MAG: hypothetical protein N2559_17760, partial [Anaerolineae bacterium]|nr:hypothetical protein [Anaerolineae bacterium]